MALKSIKDIKKKVESKQGGNFDGESPFLSLKDGDKFRIRFLQEFEEDSDLYDDRRGIVRVVEEHTSPKDYKLRAVCTAEDEGRCWACEQTSNPEIGKRWRPRLRFYTNVIVRDDSGDKVKILAQGFGGKNIGTDMLEAAEEYGALGGQDFNLKRRGSGMNDTEYSLLPLAPAEMSEADQKLELIDIDKFLKTIPYSEQAAFYSGESDSNGGDKEDW